MPKEEPDNDLCRCCHAEGAFKNLYASFFWMDVEEVVYSKLLQECFDIEMAPITQPLQHMLCTICDTCIERLQEAVKFKRQVQKCEKRFREVYGTCVGEENTFEVKVKKEIEVQFEEEPSTAFNGAKANTSGVTDTFRNMDEDDDGFSGDDDDFKQLDAVKIKKEVEDSDSEDDIVLKEVSKAAKRKAKESPAAKKGKVTKVGKGTKVAVTAPIKVGRGIKVPKMSSSKDDGEEEEELDVIQGVSVLRVKNTPLRRGVDFKAVGDKFQCLRCPETGKSYYDIGVHIKTVHLKIAKFKCPACYEPFKLFAQFLKHNLEKHNIDNRFKCKACDKAYYRKPHLLIHEESFHMLGEKIKCTECEFETYRKASYKHHMLVHSNVKEFQCKYCQKTFKRRSSMGFHERIHTGDKRKICTECGEKFVQRASLKYHMTKHHPGVDF